MKRTRCITVSLCLLLTLLLILPVLSCAVPVRADELWSEDYYRAADSGDALSETEMDDLDGKVGFSRWAPVPDGRWIVRFAVNWATSDEEIAKLAELL